MSTTTLAPTTRTPLVGWLVAEAVSLTGTRLSMIALPWFVLTTTGSAARTGLVASAEILPLVLLKAAGGPVIDRVGPRRVAVTCDLLSVLVVGAIPLLHLLGALHFAVLLVLVALAGALRGPGDGAKQALVPALVESARVPLERATGLGGAVERTAALVGAAAAGVLIAWVGPTTALAVDAASFGVSGLVLLSTSRLLRRAPSSAPAEPYLTQLREGWTFLRRDTLLLGLAVMVAVTNLFDQAYTVVLVPVWARASGGGAGAVGTLFAVWAASSVLGALLASSYGPRLPRFRVYVVAFLIAGAPKFVVLALGSPLWGVLATAVAGGIASGFINPVLGAVIFERIPSVLVGRVNSLITSLAFALMPLGGLLAGGLVSGPGLTFTLLLCGAGYFVATMAPAVRPRFREMDAAARQ